MNVIQTKSAAKRWSLQIENTNNITWNTSRPTLSLITLCSPILPKICFLLGAYDV